MSKQIKFKDLNVGHKVKVGNAIMTVEVAPHQAWPGNRDMLVAILKVKKGGAKIYAYSTNQITVENE